MKQMTPTPSMSATSPGKAVSVERSTEKGSGTSKKSGKLIRRPEIVVLRKQRECLPHEYANATYNTTKGSNEASGLRLRSMRGFFKFFYQLHMRLWFGNLKMYQSYVRI
jgi:hypothetical protein